MAQYNADELNAPSWIDREFLQMVLVQYKRNENVEIVNIDISPASLKGDHYASIMFRAKIEFRSIKNGEITTYSWIIKTLPEGECMKREMLLNTAVFETEIRMYQETLPKIEEILSEHGDNTQLAPKIIYGALTPQKVIILEDISIFGFSTAQRFLNEEEVKQLYTKLAKFHAVSYMLGKSENHRLVTGYQRGMCSDSLFTRQDMIAKGMERFINLLSTHDEFAEYIPKIKEIEKNMFDVCTQLYRAHELGVKDEIFVLNHGDYHMKNLMFKYNKNSELEKLLLVDFQICVYAPSVVDLIYSTFLAVPGELRNNYKVYWHYYWDEFIKTLKLIKYEGELPKFSQLKTAALKYKHFVVFMMAIFLPMVLAFAKIALEKRDDIEINDIIEKTDGIVFAYRNPMYIEEIRNLLPILLLDGFLD